MFCSLLILPTFSSLSGNEKESKKKASKRAAPWPGENGHGMKWHRNRERSVWKLDESNIPLFLVQHIILTLAKINLSVSHFMLSSHSSSITFITRKLHARYVLLDNLYKKLLKCRNTVHKYILKAAHHCRSIAFFVCIQQHWQSTPVSKRISNAEMHYIGLWHSR